MDYFTDDMDIIAKLPDDPSDAGYTAAQLKAAFDSAGKALKKYINETLIPGLLSAGNGVVANSAVKLATGRQLTVTDGTNTGQATTFDGSANVSLQLPSTIKADISGDVTGNVTGDITGKHTGEVAGSTARFSGEVTFNGNIILSSSDYGESLPEAGTAGRLFFKKV